MESAQAEISKYCKTESQYWKNLECIYSAICIVIFDPFALNCEPFSLCATVHVLHNIL